jgi:hypothetical protein
LRTSDGWRCLQIRAQHEWGRMNAPNIDNVRNDAAKFDAANRTSYLVGPKAARPKRDELLGTPFKPKMIVEGYLQEDAGGDVGSGGTGKSTLMLHEAVHVILGRALYGRQIVRQGGVLVVTAEDDRDITLSRLNQICNAMGLNKAEQKTVLNDFYVEDVSSTDAKLVVADHSGVHATAFVDEIIEKYKGLGLAFVSLDPTSLLGPGEQSSNDGAAQLMRTARTLHKELGAAVRLVHHVSQQVARSEIRDQYASRGASAFSDNSRSQRQIVTMTTRKFEHQGSQYELPGEISNLDLAMGHVLAIFVHKLSYAARDSTPIIVVRDGFAFRHVFIQRLDQSPAAEANRRDAEMWRVVDFIRGQLLAGKKIGKTELEEHAEMISLARKSLREARDTALDLHALTELPLPKNEASTKRKKYLAPPDWPNPANRAESRRDDFGGITNTGTSGAANPAADGTSIRRRDSKPPKGPPLDGTKEALADPIPPNPADGIRRLNGKTVNHA